MKTTMIDFLSKIVNGELEEDTRFVLDHKEGYREYCTVREFFDRYIVDKENLELDIIIEDTPKEDILNYKDLLQQEINNENEILLSRLESDTKLDIIKNYITSEEAIDNFKIIESRDEWLKVHDFILDIIDNYKLQKENGEVIENIPKEDKKIEKFKVIKDNSGDSVQLIYDGMKLDLTLLQAIILDKINEIIDRLNGVNNE